MTSRSRRQLLQYVVAPLVIAIGASCDSVSECSCPQPPSVSIEGTVMDEAGAVLEGVGVTLTVLDQGCEQPLAASFSVATDSVGYYFLGVEGEDEGTPACGEIEALRVLTASVDTVHATMDLTFGFEPPDTLDLVFPTR